MLSNNLNNLKKIIANAWEIPSYKNFYQKVFGFSLKKFNLILTLKV